MGKKGNDINNFSTTSIIHSIIYNIKISMLQKYLLKNK